MHKLNMFKKPKRNFRSRRKDSEPELPPGDEETDTNNGTVCNNNVAHSRPIEKAQPAKSKTDNVNKTEKSGKLAKVPSATSMLSFEHEDGTYVVLFIDCHFHLVLGIGRIGGIII